MRRMVAVYGGSSAHHRALSEPKYAKWLAGTAYLPDLAMGGPDQEALAGSDVVIVPERLHADMLQGARPRLLACLDRGCTVVVFGEQSVYREEPCGWLPGIDWVPGTTNYWWWLERDRPSGLHPHLPEHELWRHIGVEDATWHHHGVLRPPEGAEVLLTHDDGGAVLYVDVVSTAGTLVVATLDPLYHYGSYFMPATELFLDGFLPWLALGELSVGGLSHPDRIRKT